MSDPILIPFRAEHLMLLVNREHGEPEHAWIAVQKEKRGPAFTAVVEEKGSKGKIIACGGVIIIWRGVGAAWGVFTTDLPKHRLWITRMTRRVLEDAVRTYKLHRLETIVEAANETNRRWIEFLGFKAENSVARSYTADRKDVTRYERVLCKP